MKQTSIDRLIRMCLLLGAVASLTHELFKAFLIPAAMTSSPWRLLGIDLIVLLLLTLCVRGKKSLYLSLFVWISAGIALVLYAYFHLPELLRSPQTLLYPWLFYLIAFLIVVPSFYAARSVSGTLVLTVGGLAGMGYLAAVGYAVDPHVVLLFCLFAAALFWEKRLAVFPTRLQRVGILAGFLAAALLIAELAVAGLQTIPALQDTNRPRIALLQDLFGSTMNFADNVTTQKLGGPLYQNDTHVFSVTGNAPFYLKGRTYTTYANNSWTVDPSQAAPSAFDALHPIMGSSYLESPYWLNRTDSNLGRYRQSLLAPAYLSSNSMTVRILSGGRSTIFLPLGFQQFQSDSVKLSKFQGGSYLAASSAHAGDTYSLRYTTVETQTEAFALADTNYNQKTAAFLRALQEANPDGYQTLQEETVYARQKELILPSTVTNRTRKLAKDLTQNCNNVFEAADVIRDWLFEHCTYQTNVSYTLGGSDFVDNFLFQTHKGYCVHFATAMTVLLRAAGYPARYVEGYVSPAGENTDSTYIVTNMQAHAWVEVYSELFGYVTEEATPGIGAASTLSSSETDETESAAAGSSAPSAVSSGTSAVSSSSGKAAGSTPSGHRVFAWNIVICAALLFALAVVIRLAARAAWFAYIRRKPSDEQVMQLYAYCLRFFARLGFPCPAAEMPEHYARSVEQTLSIHDFMPVTALYLKARYGEQALTFQEIQTMRDFCRGLPHLARRAKGFWPALAAVLLA